MVGKGKGQGLGEPASRGTRYAQRNPPPLSLTVESSQSLALKGSRSCLTLECLILSYKNMGKGRGDCPRTRLYRLAVPI